MVVEVVEVGGIVGNISGSKSRWVSTGSRVDG